MSIQPDSIIISNLKKLGVEYELIQHAPFFTCAESSNFWNLRSKQNPDRTTSNAKSLLVRNKKKTEYFLVVVDCDLKIDMKELAAKLNTSRLSFASPNDLKDLMNVYPGCVNPFSLIHDKEKKIKLYIQKEVMDCKYQAFHPGHNQYSIELPTTDFQRYLISINVSLNTLNI